MRRVWTACRFYQSLLAYLIKHSPTHSLFYCFFSFQDGVQNGDETSVDCGGNACGLCATAPTLVSITSGVGCDVEQVYTSDSAVTAGPGVFDCTPLSTTTTLTFVGTDFGRVGATVVGVCDGFLTHLSMTKATCVMLALPAGTSLQAAVTVPSSAVSVGFTTALVTFICALFCVAP
jgi:hypothetical protein